jgi:uncharacterized protein YjbI with pentapeptide repeats
VNEEHVREDFAGADWSGRHLIRDTFEDCRMTGWEAGELIAEHVRFVRCRLDLANLRYAKLRQVVFDDCVLDEADLGGADISLTRFIGCSLDGTIFQAARLTRVDLRGSRLDAIGGVAALRGATIDPGQLIDLAPALADGYGIDVSPNDVPWPHGDASSAP